jgi:hypothetical protein
LGDKDEIEKLVNKFGTVIAMITYCKGTGADPKKYYIQAEILLEKLRAANYPYVSVLERRLEEN